MRPTNTTTTDAGFHRWNSPIPYLFGGLALMLGLIALALIILACSMRKSSSDQSSSEVEEKPAANPVNLPQPEMEPKIVVIMAGDDNPTYLAKPLSCIRHTEQADGRGVASRTSLLLLLFDSVSAGRVTKV
ncbi:hypothetical protein F0562_005208 [Nyssa sinensis]|uniref:Uncharacterized protein n=1 Tax=Nyssa sinensis TaxID=561372 RepID=A0A5J5AK02_9ASTE|nr:hypothetical protein F0562_005208 [Nyssa sinensis]